MKRRTFIQSILAAVASLALAQKIACKALEVSPKELAYIPNPAWENAEYEVEYHYHPDVFRMKADDSKPIEVEHAIGLFTQSPPDRFTFTNGEWIKVPPHILVEQ